MNQEQKDYSNNNVRVSDVIIPVVGFIKYKKRNEQSQTTDTSHYASVFWHLIPIHLLECALLITETVKGIEKLVH